MSTLSQDLRRAFQANGNVLHRLILYNVVVFAVLVVVKAGLHLSGQDLAYDTAVRWLTLPAYAPTLLTRPWTLLTYAFIHEDFWHILFNLLNLFYFGQIIQEYLGPRRLVALYVLGALAGGALFVVGVNFVPVLNGQLLFNTLRGASGAVTAIIVAAATLVPNYTFMLILLGPVRIKWIAAVLVLLSVAGLSGGNAGGELAHLGGAVLGFAFIKALQSGTDLGRPVLAVGTWVSSLFGHTPAMHVSYRAAPGQPARTAASGNLTATEQTELDSLLDRVNRVGYPGLSKAEKERLFYLSQR